ncbi:hypothetical protein A3A03_03730 [Candidatus Nomurabacteria bacterium RIFCSPLOWO2_01_FULL_40_18]|uniref:Cohesin domain-containing protein n=1 Tax=Candidatus Nomurabacteria bacterium RIFCSPLOWO2_01_FULL_40_18 TaxID=1801773 RepID=A0A1F6XIB1_9BACT|nr:MAG: hypothetical protein A3A03_03730 [Candidatus Nomurabacteria bacterium RIFCSPLOWO2_01_FULL_40_18]
MIKFLILVLLTVTFFIPGAIFASEMVFVPSNGAVAKGELIKINIYVMPGDDRINATQGKIIFPKDLLAVANVSYGNSILSFWPETPAQKEQGVIAFAGVSPGGYASSDRGLLFSVIFRALQEGNATLAIQDALVLKDDGAGSATQLRLGSGTISITKPIAKEESPKSFALSEELNATNDHELPESFMPLIGKDSNIFAGKYFLVFVATDKQSGIDHYEVQESKRRSPDDSKWVRAESPYELADQTLSSFIFVKALDKAQNVRLETLLPFYPQKFYQSVAFWVIIVLILLAFFFLRWKSKKY